MADIGFRRVIYRSAARDGEGYRDLPGILSVSRVNNGINGVSGLLWTDGSEYVQLIEGPPESVAVTLARIMADLRHDKIDLISDEMKHTRCFGSWFMAVLPDDQPGVGAERMQSLLAGVPDDVRSIFEPLLQP